LKLVIVNKLPKPPLCMLSVNLPCCFRCSWWCRRLA